jgi:hypothetical protein
MMRYVPFVILLGALSGCAALEQQSAADTEKLLAATGFQMQPAEGTMPAFRIVATGHGAKTVYSYSDPLNCRCAYVGGPKAYADYQELEISEEIVRDMNALSMNMVPMDWDDWGLSDTP